MRRQKVAIIALVLCLLGLTACGKDGHVHIDTAMEAIYAHDYEQALEETWQAIESGEDARLAYRAQGLAYMGLTHYEEAIEAFEEALSCSEGIVRNIDYDTNYYLATAYYKLGDVQETMKIYDTIIHLKPKENHALYLRGSVLLRDGKYEAAKEDFDAAIEIAPTDFDQIIDIYQVLEECGYAQTGRELLQAAIDRDAKEMTDYDKGRFYFYLQNYEDARDYLERARDHSGAGAVLYLGRTWEILGDYNYAASVYQTQLQIEPNDEIYNQLGMCRLKMGDPEAALDAFVSGQQVLDCGIMQTLRFNEIVAYERLGQFDKAAALMRTYLKAYPDDEDAQRENLFLKTR